MATAVGGRETGLGIGIEATAGTSVSPTIYPKWTEFGLQPNVQKSTLTSAREQRIAISDSRIQRSYASGNIGVVPNVEIAPYFLKLALGSLSTATATNESAVYDHTITPQNAYDALPTASIVEDMGGALTTTYDNVVVNTLSFEVSDGYASMTAELMGRFNQTGSLSSSYTKEYEFAYDDLTMKFGSDISTAEGNNATKLRNFNLQINNNIQTDEAFLSGSNAPVAGGFFPGDLEVTGSYSVQFGDASEYNKYVNNTLEAGVAEFTGESVGTQPTDEKIKFDLAKMVLTAQPLERNQDGLIIVNQEFSVEHDSSDGSITATVTNEDDGSNY